MDTSDFVPLEEPGAPRQKNHMGTKIRPKRGKSTQKQKRRLAMKLDKVRDCHAVAIICWRML